MQILFRSNSSRILCGVAAGLAERYGLRLWLVRVAWIAAFLVSPYAALAYLALAVSMPSEYRFASGLHVRETDTSVTGRSRFNASAKVLTGRLLHGRSASSNTAGILLLLFGAFLELPNIEGVNFYAFHPIVTGISVTVGAIATPFFYLSLALLLWLLPQKRHSPVAMILPRRSAFALERNEIKMIG
ncbi:MAG TPA: PspC domain-containing protein, partial [Candidatus Kapabacteria bacterium]